MEAEKKVSNAPTYTSIFSNALIQAAKKDDKSNPQIIKDEPSNNIKGQSKIKSYDNRSEIPEKAKPNYAALWKKACDAVDAFNLAKMKKELRDGIKTKGIDESNDEK